MKFKSNKLTSKQAQREYLCDLCGLVGKTRSFIGARHTRDLYFHPNLHQAVGVIRFRSYSTLHPSFNLVIRDLLTLRSEGNFIISHVLREANQGADGLAKHGMSLPPESSCCTFVSLPLFLSIAFCADVTGVAFPRGGQLLCSFCFGVYPFSNSIIWKKKKGLVRSLLILS